MSGIDILGTGHYVPENRLSNDDLSKMVKQMMNGYFQEQVLKHVILAKQKIPLN